MTTSPTCVRHRRCAVEDVLMRLASLVKLKGQRDE
jgi:hypothetical protein